MPAHEVTVFWPPSPTLVAIGIAALLLILYLARHPGHNLILGTTRGFHSLLRMAAYGVARSEQRLTRRNKDTVLRIGAEMRERAVEREFARVSATVKRDISAYPALHRTLAEQIARIDEDYQHSAEEPAMPPAWLDAIGAVAQIRANNDPAVARILEDMHGTLESASHQALLEYRTASRRRHRGLRRMLPYWRRLDSTLEDVNRTVKGLEQRISTIDSQMDRYQQLRAAEDQTARILSLSTVTQFFIASLVLAIAALAVVFNYQLLLPGMAKVVAGGIGPVATAEIASAFITMLQIGMGLVILECSRVTRLLPLISGLHELPRTRLLTAAIGILITLTALEASIAFSTPQHVAAGLGIASGEGPQWLTSMALMVLGTVLPLVLALVAIPLESFINSSRVLAGATLAAALRLTVFGLRLLGNLIKTAGILLVRGYDLVIFLPLWMERQLTRVGKPTPTRAPSVQPEAAAGKESRRKTKPEPVPAGD